MKVNAAQHVSAMLTSRQSPRGHAGYQTLYYTRGLLTPDEVGVIERLAQYGSARDGISKWQSYRLTDRRHVISRIVPIPDPDDFGRRGRYFTHSLVCDVTAGQQFDDALFGLLQPRHFLPSLDKALAAEGMRTGHAPEVTVDAGGVRDNGNPACLRDWSGEQLNRLYVLMSDPRRLTRQGGYVALVGSEGQILEALRVAFLLSRPGAQKFCSFDTNASGSDAPARVAFWGRGSESVGAASHVIDAARRRVTIPESSPLWADGFSPERLSMPLRNAVVALLSHPSEEMLRSLVKGRYAAFIGESVYQAMLRENELPLTPADSGLLSPFGQAHGGLGLLLALKSGDDAQRLRRLAAMDSQSYTECSTQLMTRPDFRPWQVFSPIFMYTWFRLFRDTYRLDDLTTAITKVAEHGGEGDRKYLEDIHEHLDPDESQELGRWLRSSPLHFERLQAALDAAVHARASGNSDGKSRALLRRIRHPFGG
ncbi:MAG TPA: hypothetical protein VIP46_02025 [Pyrinomonadaceae bacterium]